MFSSPTKFAISLTALVAMAMGTVAISCYDCEGPMGEQGGCGQDPWTSHSMSAPNVDTAADQTMCYVSNSNYPVFKITTET